MYDTELKEVYSKIYIFNQYIFKDDTIQTIKQKITCGIKQDILFKGIPYIIPSRIYLWSEYKYKNIAELNKIVKSDKIMLGHKLVKKNELLKISIEPSDSSIKDHKLYKYLIDLKVKINNVIIQETPENSNYTSYSVNKGDQLVFCIRSKQTNKIHNINELKYVAIHELSHIACPEIGHTNLFYEINKLLIDKAIEYNLYKYIDYDKNTIEYCGIELNKTIASKR